MAKQNNTSDKQNGMTQGIDRAFALVGSAVKDLKIVTDSVDSVSKTVDRRKTTDVDNAVKVSRADTEAKKEDNRHDEAMAKIEIEYKKLSEASANGELKWSMVRDMVQMIRAEFNKLISMDDTAFLSEESRISRENLHKTMLELSKEILRA